MSELQSVLVPVNMSLEIWGWLVEAYHGVSLYFSIQAFLVDPQPDSSSMRGMKAAETIAAVCSHFAERWSCEVLLEIEEVTDWLSIEEWREYSSASGFSFTEVWVKVVRSENG